MLMEWNYRAAAWFRSIVGTSELFDTAVVVVAEFGSYVVPATLVILFLLRGKHRADSLFVFAATIIGIGWAHVVQELYVHPRPFELYDTLLMDATGDSFPSQHASTLFPFSLAFLLRGRTRIGLLFLSWAVMNTTSRIIVGYHFPMDIIAGLLIGVIVVWGTGQFQRHIDRLSTVTERIENEAWDRIVIRTR